MPTSSKTTSSTPSGREGNQLCLRATTGQPGQAQSLDEDHHQEKEPWGHDGSTNAALHGGGPRAQEYPERWGAVPPYWGPEMSMNWNEQRSAIPAIPRISNCSGEQTEIIHDKS